MTTHAKDDYLKATIGIAFPNGSWTKQSLTFWCPFEDEILKQPHGEQLDTVVEAFMKECSKTKINIINILDKVQVSGYFLIELIPEHLAD